MNYLLTLLFLAFFSTLSAQTRIEYKFRVYLTDKGTADYCISQPERFLSRAAIERKKRQNVPIRESDLPISQDYFRLLERAGARVVTHSRWFKTIVVQVPDSMRINSIAQLSFVDSVRLVWRGHDTYHRSEVRPRLVSSHENERTDCFFGRTSAQFALHNAKPMIKAGFRGDGIRIGVADAGFANVDVIPYFDNLQIGNSRSFVPRGELLAGSGDHGTRVLSTMSVKKPGLMIGSAPNATFWLMRTEDIATEFPVEEDYWVAAIEFADSLGLDIVNTSLGYSTFDDPSMNYTHADLTGRVAFISRAADKAFDKGMLLVVSAGNMGNTAWQTVTPPADAHNVLAVGAVGTDGELAAFSSRGFTADGRIRPDVVSVGRSTIVLRQCGVVGTGYGTSFSSPFLAGLIASLWSINPYLHRSEVLDIVKRSSDRFHSPDTLFGRGIPDFQKAMRKMLQTLEVHVGDVSKEGWFIMPTNAGFFVGYSHDISRLRPLPTFSLLDDAGNLLSAYTLDNENSRVLVSVASEVRERSEYVYFVLSDWMGRRVVRVRL